IDRGDTWHHEYIRQECRSLALLDNFQHQAGHTVNAGVTARYHTHRLAGQGAAHRQLCPSEFLGQVQRDAFLAIHELGNPGEIALLPNDHVCAAQGVLGLSSHEGYCPRSEPDYIQATALRHASSPGAASAASGFSWRKMTSEKYDSFWPRKACTSVTTRASGVPTLST